MVTPGNPETAPRHLLIVLGDQLDANASIFDNFDPSLDAVWMAEVDTEISRLPSHKLRIAGFLAAMRHFRDTLRKKGVTVHYAELTANKNEDAGADHAEVLAASLKSLRPERILLTRPGDYRVLKAVESCVSACNAELELLEDRSFYATPAEFDEWRSGRKELVMEHFYRLMRKRHDVLVDARGKPEGGTWNFDSDNRETFGKTGPKDVPHPPRFRADAVTRDVMDLVKTRYGRNPGSLDEFNLPVTSRQAQRALAVFIEERLEKFGAHQDAMWTGEQTLWHSCLSFALNVKLLQPRDCVAAAVAAYREGRAPLNSVEGFVRQILGWREFIRGIYWAFMPDYAGRNALGCDPANDVPSFFWDGDTDMTCIRDSMNGLLRTGYAHHIQRLMVLGLFAQLADVNPLRFHEWHMAMYVDSVDWVSLPNTVGMSQYGDGGIVGSKPYCASGRYVDRMSNYCNQCRYSPAKAYGDDACPFTVLYWDFLARHRSKFSGNRRMRFQIVNLDRKQPGELRAIRKQAKRLRESIHG